MRGDTGNKCKNFKTDKGQENRTDKGAEMKMKNRLLNSKGFTLIELLLVVGIIGVLLAVIIPKAIRANINSKYGIVEKNAAELKSYAVQWAEKSIRAQDEQTSVSTLADYYASLTGQAGGIAGGPSQAWVATANPNNWNMGTPSTPAAINFITIQGRTQITAGGLVGPPTIPEDTVEHIIPPEKTIKNPFNGASIFRSPNDPPNKPGGAAPVTGALALGFIQEPVSVGGYYYFAFAYQGTDNTAFALPTAAATDVTTFHAGSGLATIPALKNGELFARIR